MIRRTCLATVALVLICLSSPVLASISIDWQSDANGSQYVIDETFSNLAIGSTVQLIWTADQAVTPMNHSDPLTPSGGDISLGTRPTTEAGYWLFGVTSYDATLAPWSLAEDDFVGGYVYQRVFNTPFGITPTAGDCWGDGTYISLSLTDQDPTTAPPNASYLFASSGSSFQLTCIPEPGTMSLLALGIAAIGLRYRRRR